MPHARREQLYAMLRLSSMKELNTLLDASRTVIWQLTEPPFISLHLPSSPRTSLYVHAGHLAADRIGGAASRGALLQQGGPADEIR